MYFSGVIGDLIDGKLFWKQSLAIQIVKLIIWTKEDLKMKFKL